jgi:hypothetical protein
VLNERSTAEDVVNLGRPASSEGSRRRHRLLHDAGVVVVTAVFILGLLNVPGVRSATAEASSGGWSLSVKHATVTRPGLASPFEIAIARPGGFEGPVTVAVAADYLALFDENGLDPQPNTETADGEWLIWEVEPPDGDRLTLSYDARIEPAAQSGRDGTVAVWTSAGEPVVDVSFHTTVLP